MLVMEYAFMKKILTIIAALLVIAAMTFNISAAVTPEVKCVASENSIKIGETVTVTVHLENCHKIKTLGITPSYDKEIFTLVSGEWLLKDGLIADFNASTGDGVFTYSEDKDCNGEIFRYTLRAKSTSIFGDTTLSATAILQNSDYSSAVRYTSVNAVLKIESPETTPATTPATTPNTTPNTTPATTPTTTDVTTDETTTVNENDTLETPDENETAYEPIGTVDKTEEQTDKQNPENTDTTTIGADKPATNKGSLLTVIIASIVAIAAIVGIVVIKVREKRM